jgi:poly(3-hydroxybutyrate) depolymerase
VRIDLARELPWRHGRLYGWISGWLILAALPGARGQVTRPATTSSPADVPQRLDLPSGGFYWLRTPSDYKRGDRAPLVLCLHGTDDPARDAIAFWASCGPQRGAVWAAPQASGRGWTEKDLVRLRETWADLSKRITFDEDRVLLAGFSAGGAMAFHWLYREGFPAAAVATLANYLPPGVTAADIVKHKQVPIFYAVGMEDINHDRMRTGLALLRDEGVRVTLVRPPLGHTLSPEVGREAVAWFEGLCRDATRRRLDEASAAMHRDQVTGSGQAAVEAERVLTQARWHDAESTSVAEALLTQAVVWGRGQLAQADRLAAVDRQGGAGAALDAITCLRAVEGAYAGTSLAQVARSRRERIEADPAVREALAERDRRWREQEAMSLYLDVQRFVADGNFEAARRTCQMIVSGYDGTPAADRASALLPKLPRRVRR